MAVNKDRLLEHATFLEALPEHRFNMSNWAGRRADKDRDILWAETFNIGPDVLDENCNSSGCICGWAVQNYWPVVDLSYVEGYNTGDHWEIAGQQIFDLTPEESKRLFYNDQWHKISPVLTALSNEEMPNITPRDAAFAIRIFVSSSVD